MNQARRQGQVEAEIEIAAPPEVVWRALTDANELVRWFPLEARVTPGAGGSIWMSWKNEFQFAMPIATWDEPRQLTLAVPAPATDSGLPAAPVAIKFVLGGHHGTTVLRLVHSGFGPGADWDDAYDATALGWQFQLFGLKRYLEEFHGRDRAVAYASCRGLTHLGRDEAWARVIGSTGLGAVMPATTPGARVRFANAGSTPFQAVLHQWMPPKSLVAILDGDPHRGLFRCHIDDLAGRRDIYLWLSAYDADVTLVRDMERHWQALLDPFRCAG